MKMGLCAEDAVTHNLTVVWTGLDTRELEEGEQLEIRVAAGVGGIWRLAGA